MNLLRFLIVFCFIFPTAGYAAGNIDQSLIKTTVDETIEPLLKNTIFREWQSRLRLMEKVISTTMA